MKKTFIILGLALIVPSMAFASFDTSLSYGSRGSAVEQLQQFLITQGCLNSNPTGYFGALTFAGVKCFQNKYGVVSTGYFGVMSRNMATKVLDISISPTSTLPAQPFQSSVNLSQGVAAPPPISPLIGVGPASTSATGGVYVIPTQVTATTALPAQGIQSSVNLSQGASAPPPLSPLIDSN